MAKPVFAMVIRYYSATFTSKGIFPVNLIRMGCVWLLLAPLWVMAEPVEYVDAVAWGEDSHWLSRQSEHFEIAFPDGYQDMASHALNIAEQVHADLSGFFGSVPATRTRMVLTDDFDYSNGSATPLPYASIRLFASPPDGATGLETYDDWLHLLIRHEYAHILHLEMNRSIVKDSRYVFGRTFFNFPHLLTPSFLIEGLAVYLETSRQLGYGRLQGSLYNMQMRMEFLNGYPDSLSQAVVPVRDWPLGKQYLYGAWFIEYLMRTEGEDKVREFLRLYSGRIIPYWFLDHDARRAFGMPMTWLWQMFLADMSEQVREQNKQLLAHRQDGEPLLSGAWFRPQLAVAAGKLYSIENNGEDQTAIRQFDRLGRNSAQSTLFRPENGRDLAVSSDGTLAFSRYVYRVGGQEWGDVFLLQDDDEVRLTYGLRARRLVWLPDASALLVSRIVAGRSELLRVDRDNGSARSLWQGRDGDVLGEFDVSPDGLSVVAAIKRPQQGWNLERLDLASGLWQAITHTRAIENSPHFTASGDLLFSADYDGVFNIYRLEADGRSARPLTQVVSGAFEPVVVADQLVFAEYGRDGYQLRQMPVQSAGQELAAVVLSPDVSGSVAGQYDYPPVYGSATQQSPDRDYSPWSSLTPTAWYPSFTADAWHSAAGILITGTDTLGRHRYSLQGRYDSKNKLMSGLIDYAYDNRWQMRAERSWRYSYGAPRSDQDQIIRKDDLTLQRNHIVSAWEDRLSLDAGLVFSSEKLLQDAGLPWYGGEQFQQGLAGIALQFDDEETLLQVPGMAYGNRWDLVLESNDVLKSDFSGEVLQGRWGYILDLPGRDTLALSLAAGAADETSEPFTLGGGPGYDDELFGRDSVFLAGYVEGIQYGHFYQKERLSWTHWLGRNERNWRLSPLGLGDYSMTLFAEGGAAWYRHHKVNWLPAVGAEARAEVILGYRLIMPMVLGVAQGLDAEGETQVYLGFGINY
jgi:hypothetical protein